MTTQPHTLRCDHDPAENVLIRVGNATEGYMVCAVPDCDAAGTWSTPASTRELEPLTKAQILARYGGVPPSMIASSEPRTVGAVATDEVAEAQLPVAMQALIPASEIPGIADPEDGLPTSADSTPASGEAT